MGGEIWVCPSINPKIPHHPGPGFGPGSPCLDLAHFMHLDLAYFGPVSWVPGLDLCHFGAISGDPGLD